MDKFWIYAILASLIFDFNIIEVKKTVTREVVEAAKHSWRDPFGNRNIFKRKYSY